MAVDSFNSIVVAGWQDLANSGSQFLVAKFNRRRTLDNTFGTGETMPKAGYVTSKIGNVSEAGAVTIQPDDGKIIAAGWSDTPDGVRQCALARYTAGGDLDPDFGAGSGTVTEPILNRAMAFSVLVRPDGNILVAGQAKSKIGQSLVFAACYRADAALDDSYAPGFWIDDFVATEGTGEQQREVHGDTVGRHE